MLIMVCYFKRICGINQPEDRVTWPDLLHRHQIFHVSAGTWSRSWVSGNDRLFPRGSEFGPNPEIPANPAIQLRPRLDLSMQVATHAPAVYPKGGTIFQNRLIKRKHFRVIEMNVISVTVTVRIVRREVGTQTSLSRMVAWARQR